MLSKFKKVLFLGALSWCFLSKAGFCQELNIVTSAFPQYDFVRAIVKDKAKVSMLLKIGADAHSFEPTPKDLIAIENSSLFVYNGGENEEWLLDFLKGLSHKPHMLAFCEMVKTRPEEHLEGVDEEHHHGHHHGHQTEASLEHNLDAEHEHEQHADADHEHEHGFDEHVWTSPRNDIIILEKLCAEIVALDRDNKDFYEKNTRDYIARFKKIDEEYQKIVKEGFTHTIVFGDRFPLLYFAKDYSLEYFAAFSGCSNETEVSARTMSFLIEKSREKKVPVIFKIELSSPSIADTIADEVGAQVMTFNTGHNLTLEQFKRGTTMADLFEMNYIPLKTALGHK